MDFFIRGVRALSMACGVVAAAALIAAVLVVCQMVAFRYFLNLSTVWQTEFVTFAIVGATFVGCPYVLLTRGHVNVDLVPLYVGPKSRFALAMFSAVAAFAFSVIVAFYSAEYFYEAWDEGWVTETVWALPLWIPILPMPIGMGLLALQYLADIICLITGREAPFGIQPELQE